MKLLRYFLLSVSLSPLFLFQFSIDWQGLSNFCLLQTCSEVCDCISLMTVATTCFATFYEKWFSSFVVFSRQKLHYNISVTSFRLFVCYSDWRYNKYHSEDNSIDIQNAYMLLFWSFSAAVQSCHLFITWSDESCARAMVRMSRLEKYRWSRPCPLFLINRLRLAIRAGVTMESIPSRPPRPTLAPN